MPRLMALWAWLSLFVPVHAQEMVGPGGMTPYSAGGGGRSFGGYGQIRDAVVGFFISGSIEAMNGVYGPRLEELASLPASLAADVVIGAYMHDNSGWTLAHVRVTDGGDQSEWVFFDAQHVRSSALPQCAWRLNMHLHAGFRPGPTPCESTLVADAARTVCSSWQDTRPRLWLLMVAPASAVEGAAFGRRPRQRRKPQRRQR